MISHGRAYFFFASLHAYCVGSSGVCRLQVRICIAVSNHACRLLGPLWVVVEIALFSPSKVSTWRIQTNRAGGRGNRHLPHGLSKPCSTGQRKSPKDPSKICPAPFEDRREKRRSGPGSVVRRGAKGLSVHLEVHGGKTRDRLQSDEARQRTRGSVAGL